MFSHMKDRAPGGCRAWKAGRLMDARHVRGIRRDVMVRERAACHSIGHVNPSALIGVVRAVLLCQARPRRKVSENARDDLGQGVGASSWWVRPGTLWVPPAFS